jgi:hypothetical protein
MLLLAYLWDIRDVACSFGGRSLYTNDFSGPRSMLGLWAGHNA